MLDAFSNKGATVALALAVFGSLQLRGAGIFVEGRDGELSADYQSPTVFELTEGSFVLSGILQGNGDEQNFFTLSVSEGYEITEFNILSYFSEGFQNSSFLGVQPGPTLSDSPAIISNEANQIPINFVLFSEALIDSPFPLLTTLNVGDPIGGSPTLGEGNYAFWLNETAAGSEWELEFVVEPVPEPSSVLLIALACNIAFFRRKRLGNS